LDEAHVYGGATGMETAMLIRRLKARIRSEGKTQFILTSATLGSGPKSNKEIVTFAKNLTGEHFDEKSIIRAIREVYEPCKTTISYSDDLFIDLSDSSKPIEGILEKYKIPYTKDIHESEILYDVCVNAEQFNRIRSIATEPTDIRELSLKSGCSIDLIIALMYVSSRAYKHGKALVNARYHFFLRALEGLYMSFLPSKKISLIRKQTIIENANEYPVFEITTCNDCGKLAIVGKLEQSSRFLDRNCQVYEEGINFFAVKENDDSITDDDSTEESEDYVLCVKCGSIMRTDEAHNPPCKCGTQHSIEVTKAQKTKCPSCGIGKYQRFYLGIDAATSVIATSLFDQLPEFGYKDIYIRSHIDVDDNPFFTGNLVPTKPKERTGKQFLIFSDSRQEAAYFASYMEKFYKSFIRRRGIYQLLFDAKLSDHNMTITDFTSRLSNIFSHPTNRSFSSSNSDTSNLSAVSGKNAWIAILDEMANQSRNTSMVSLGLLKFEYLGNTPEIIEKIANTIKLSYDSTKSLLDQLVNDVLKFGAVDVRDNYQIDSDDRKYVFYFSDQKYVSLLKKDNVSFIMNWQATSRKNAQGKFYVNRRLFLISRSLNCDYLEAEKFLLNYWKYLTNPEINKHAFVTSDNQKYLISTNDIVIKSALDESFKAYQCKKCKKITVYNVDGKCEILKCKGDLEDFDSRLNLEENHFAKLFSIDKLKPFFIKEHTAQLSKKESLDYQKQFIKKDIHALSCSTTFEMGVDVGSLETVFLRNMPPLPSNYAQRAGRAGRSKNAAAYAITYAKLSSHDFNYYEKPKEMINGTILAPLFSLENRKVIYRHIFAVALSKFFQKFTDMYGGNKIENFVDKKGYLKLIEYLSEEPTDLKEIIKKSIPNELHSELGINDFSWKEQLIGDEGILTIAVKEYEDVVTQYQRIIDRTKKSEYRELVRYNINLRKYKDKQLIDFLVRNNVLPKYGFPVDTVELQQNINVPIDKSKELNLNRDLQIAISEYAPGSEIVADGNLYTSRYIKQSATKDGNKHWETGYIAKCEEKNCRTLNYKKEIEAGESYHCMACDSVIRKSMWKPSIEPRAGFISDPIIKPVPLSRPEKHYRSADFYLGNKYSKKLDAVKLSFETSNIVLESTQNDSLMIVTNDQFSVCPSCGYSQGTFDYESDDEIEGNKKSKKGNKSDKSHQSPFGRTCLSSMYPYYLHHIFNTDVVKMTFSEDLSDVNTALSVLYAILNAISKVLNIERNDIKGCLHKYQDTGNRKLNALVIYDAVPGGVGHTRRLISDDGIAMKEILIRAYSDMSDCTCDPSCYNCLRSYSNQKIHENLNRHSAEKFLIQFIGDFEVERIVMEESEKISSYFDIYFDTEKSQINSSNWSEVLNFVSSDVADLFEDFDEAVLPIPSYICAKVYINDTEYPVEMVWHDQKILIFDDISSIIPGICSSEWLIMDKSNLDINEIKEKMLWQR
jgi:hypothetical protein